MRQEILTRLPSLTRNNFRGGPRSYVIYQLGPNVAITDEPHVLKKSQGGYSKREDKNNKTLVVGSGASVGFSLRSQPDIRVKDFTQAVDRWVEPHGEICLPGRVVIDLPPEAWIPLPRNLGVMARYTAIDPYPQNR